MENVITAPIVEGQESENSEPDLEAKYQEVFGPKAPKGDPLQYQREMAYQQQMAALAQQAQQSQAYAIQAALSQLPPDQQQVALQQLQQEYRVWSAQQEMSQARQYVNQMEQSVVPLLKRQAVEKVSKDFNIPVEAFRDADSPDKVRAIVQGYIQARKSGNFQNRISTGVDKVPGIGNSSGTKLSREAIKAKYVNKGNLSGYYNEMKANGY